MVQRQIRMTASTSCLQFGSRTRFDAIAGSWRPSSDPPPLQAMDQLEYLRTGGEEGLHELLCLASLACCLPAAVQQAIGDSNTLLESRPRADITDQVLTCYNSILDPFEDKITVLLSPQPLSVDGFEGCNDDTVPVIPRNVIGLECRYHQCHHVPFFQAPDGGC